MKYEAEKYFYSKSYLAVNCLICEEPVRIEGYENPRFAVRICDKCKAAVIKMREAMETERN